jgi:hypothetical protein
MLVRRPTKRTPNMVRLILDGLAEGKSLHALCKRSALPSEQTVYAWIREDEDFRASYELAQELADRFAAEILELADDCSEDQASIAKARLQVDARKWSAARMAPRKWGDRAQVDLGGQADQPVAGSRGPIRPVVTTTRGDLGFEDRRRFLAAQRGASAREFAREMGDRARDLREQPEHLGSEAKDRLLREVEAWRERIRRPKD